MLRPLVLVGAVLASVALAACDLTGLNRGVERDVGGCIDLWNRRLDSAPSLSLTGNPSPARNVFGSGTDFGFVARRVAIVPAGYGCRTWFDLQDGTVYEISTNITNESNEVWGWKGQWDVLPLGLVQARIPLDWNACQNDDGTIARSGECRAHDRSIRPRPVARQVEADARRSFVADLYQGYAPYWLGIRFRRAVAGSLGRLDGNAQIEYSAWAGGRRTLFLQVLTYSPRLTEIPTCLYNYCASGDHGRVLLRLDRGNVTVLVVEPTGRPVPAHVLREIRRALEPAPLAP